MHFTKLPSCYLALICGSILLSACSTKPSIETADPIAEQAQLADAQSQQQFADLLERLKKEDLSTEELSQLLARFNQLAAARPDYLGARINAADIALRLGNHADAQAHYLAVLSFLDTPVSVDANATQQSQESSEQTAQTANQAKFRIHCYNQLGLLARQAGQFEQAETYYRQALTLNPDQPESVKNLAILLDLYRGRLTEALPLYEQYQTLVGDKDPKIKDWIFDLKNRLPADEAMSEAIQAAEEGNAHD